MPGRPPDRRSRGGGVVPLAGLFALLVAVVLVPAVAGYPAPTPHRAQAVPGVADKGPVGWDVYRQLDRLPELRRGRQTLQFSSFDRTGANDDGFEGTYSCLRVSAAGCVIAEVDGPGQIASMWFTRDRGDVTATGNIRVELDGKVVLDAPLADVVRGRLGLPFRYPLVATADQSSGGVYIKVPMPFRSSMQVTTTNNPLFYHVSYQRFADAEGVATFDSDTVPADVIARFKAAGHGDPKPAPATDPVVRTRSGSLAAGETITLASFDEPGRINELSLTLPSIVGAPGGVGDGGRAFTRASEFTVALDPDNAGVRLTRRLDRSVPDQEARVLVDGEPAGHWQGLSAVRHTWYDQELVIPASLTAGKSSIRIRTEYTGEGRDFNEFRYWVDSRIGERWYRTDTVDVGPTVNERAIQAAHDYRIVDQVWQGRHAFRYPTTDQEQERAARSRELLAGLRLRISFDGVRTVDAPLGEFFGAGLEELDVRSLMFAMDSADRGAYTSWWPMPFARSATVQLHNPTGTALDEVRARVTAVADPSVPGRMLGPSPTLGYFHADSRRGDTVQGREWTFADITGTGRFVGVNHTMVSHIDMGNRRGYLEGDERVLVDGSNSPAMHGTGTEDFYEAGWYYNRRHFSNPTNGAPGMRTNTGACSGPCEADYRLMIADAVDFSSSLRFTIEPGRLANELAWYGSTAFWYGHRGLTSTRQTDVVELGDAASERQHDYDGGAAPVTLTSVYEGENDTVGVTDEVRAASGPVAFTVAVDPRNQGVRIRRTSDQREGGQHVAVRVNGQPVGRWSQPLHNTSQRWLDDSFELPAEVTEGQHELRIELLPVDGAPAWTAAQYAVFSHLSLPDQAAPTAVADVRARGTKVNAIDVSWRPASDTGGSVVAYQVYASADPQVQIGPDTLAGTSRTTTFRHTGIGVDQTLHYRVVAVDGSGRRGAPSGVATATSGTWLWLEGEVLPVVGEADAPVLVQGKLPDVEFSQLTQRFVRATEVGEAVRFALSVPTAGTYRLAPAFTHAPDFAVVRVSLAGSAVGDPLDLYAPDVTLPGHVPLSEVELSAGEHVLEIEVTGRNPDSSRYFVGLDYVLLERVT